MNHYWQCCRNIRPANIAEVPEALFATQKSTANCISWSNKCRFKKNQGIFLQNSSSCLMKPEVWVALSNATEFRLIFGKVARWSSEKYNLYGFIWMRNNVITGNKGAESDFSANDSCCRKWDISAQTAQRLYETWKNLGILIDSRDTFIRQLCVRWCFLCYSCHFLLLSRLTAAQGRNPVRWLFGAPKFVRMLWFGQLAANMVRNRRVRGRRALSWYCKYGKKLARHSF